MNAIGIACTIAATMTALMLLGIDSLADYYYALGPSALAAAQSLA